MSPIAKEKSYFAMTAIAGALPFLAVGGLAAFLGFNGLDALFRIGLNEALTTVWLPYSGKFGMMPLFAGTLATTLLALLLSIPVGLGASLYLALYSTPRVRRVADAAIALLSGMPSVVIGLWGMTWILPLSGNSFFSATLVLTVMIVPTFTLLAGAAIRQVPADLVETTRALGVSENVVARAVIRHALKPLAGAATIASCRGLGEAVALSMVAGNVPNLPTLFGPVSTLTTTLIIEYDGAVGLHRAALYLLALLVVTLIAATSTLSRFDQRRAA